MSSDFQPVLYVAFLLWGLAVAYKAWSALSKKETYTFSFWDGGLLRDGRRLTPLGAKIRLGAGLAISGWCAVLLAGVRVGRAGSLIAVGLIVLSVISDFVNAED